MTTQCEHLHIMYDKLNDCNFCEDCMEIFFEDEYTLEQEDKLDDSLKSESEINLARLNSLTAVRE